MLQIPVYVIDVAIPFDLSYIKPVNRMYLLYGLSCVLSKALAD